MSAIFNAKYYYEAGTFTDNETPNRYGIDCVRIEPHPVKGVLLIATEGHVLGVWHDEWGSCDRPVLIRYDESLDTVCGMMNSEWQSAPFRCMAVNDDGTITLLTGFAGDNSSYKPGNPVAVFHGLVSEDKFPNWRNVLPVEETPRMDINPKYAELFTQLNNLDFARLAIWISPFNGHVSHGKTSPAAVVKVDGRDDFVGLVMGMVPQSAGWPGDVFDTLRGAKKPDEPNNPSAD